MENEFKYYPNKKHSGLSFLETPIIQFFEIIKSYTDKYAKGAEAKFDVPYYYNERATLSVFAGGIWRADEMNLVLEEYSTMKDKADGPSRGRRDIWFLCGNHSCRAEAKQKFRYLDIFTETTAKELIDLVIEEAESTRVTSPKNEEDKNMGILFIIPKIRSNKGSFELHKEKYYSLIDEQLAMATKNGEYTFLRASYWDESIIKKKHHYTDNREHECFYPGVDTIFCLRESL